MQSSKAQFYKGDRVSTPLGLGQVVYYRLKPPNYYEVDAYSVFLFSKANVPGYQGTIFNADHVCLSER